MPDDNVVPFPGAEETVAVFAEMDRLSLIIRWSAEMFRAGHMPADVAKAFSEHFGAVMAPGEPDEGEP